MGQTPTAQINEHSMFYVAVGDVHGCHDMLADLLARCAEHLDGRPHRFIFLGDYIDRGPSSREVVENLIELEASNAGHIFLRGNHEQMLLQAAMDPCIEAEWLKQGGAATLASYGVTTVHDLPDAHVNWLVERPLSHDDGLRFFVHAGVHPDRPTDRQSADDLLWIREPFLSSRKDFGYLIVHGHSPTADRRPDHRPNRLNLDTGACFGGRLTAAAFDLQRREPIAILQSPR